MSDDKNIDTPVLIKGNTLDFGTSSTSESTSSSSVSNESTKKKRSSKSEKLEKLIEDSNKQNKEFNETLNKLNDLLKNNSENLNKLSENIENNTKETKKNSEEKEDNKKRNSNKKSSAVDYFLGDDSSELSDSEKTNALISKVAGNQKLHGVAEDTGTSALGSINPILGVIASGLDSAGINTKSVSSFLMSKYKDRKSNKKSTDSSEDQNKTATEIKEDDSDQKLITNENPSTKALAAPIESKLSEPVSNKTATEIKEEKSESTKAKEKNEEDEEKKSAKELATKRHKETITELKSIDKSVKEGGESKGIIGGITAALGAGGLALIGGMIFSKKFRDMVVGNVKDWFTSPIDSIQSSISSFLVKLQAKMIMSAEKTVASIASKVTSATTGIAKIAETAISSISKIISPATNLIKKTFEKMTSSVGKVISDIAGKIGSTGIGKGLKTITSTISGILKASSKGLKFVGKAFKGLMKAIPGVGLIMGLINAYKRWKDGDWKGALMELGSGALSLIPGVGTVASLGMDAAIITRDVINSDENGNLKTSKSGQAKTKNPSGNPSTSEFASNTTPSASEDITAAPFRTKSPTTKEILGLIAQKTAEYDYDFNRVAGRISVESNFNPRAVSPVGAKGLGQFMDPTWKDWGRGKDVFDPEANIDATIRYMMYLDKRYNGDIEKADTAYNWGMGYVDQAAAQYGDGWREMASKYGFNYKNKKTGRTEHRAMPKEAYEYSTKNKNATKSFELARGNYDSNVKVTSNVSPEESSRIRAAIMRESYNSRKMIEDKTGANLTIGDKKSYQKNMYEKELETQPTKPVVVSQGTSPGSLVTSSSPQTATTIINQKQQTELMENMSKNQTPIPQQQETGGSSSVTINNSNFTPVNTSAYIALHQG